MVDDKEWENILIRLSRLDGILNKKVLKKTEEFMSYLRQFNLPLPTFINPDFDDNEHSCLVEYFDKEFHYTLSVYDDNQFVFKKTNRKTDKSMASESNYSDFKEISSIVLNKNV